MNKCSHEDVTIEQAGKSNYNQVMYRFSIKSMEKNRKKKCPAAPTGRDVRDRRDRNLPGQIEGQKTMFNLSTTTIIVHCA